MTQYNDAAWVIGCRDRDEFNQRFREIVAEQILTARYYRRLARIARRRGDMVLFRELAIRAIRMRRSAYMLCVDCELTVEEIIAILRRHV